MDCQVKATAVQPGMVGIAFAGHDTEHSLIERSYPCVIVRINYRSHYCRCHVMFLLVFSNDPQQRPRAAAEICKQRGLAGSAGRGC